MVPVPEILSSLCLFLSLPEPHVLVLTSRLAHSDWHVRDRAHRELSRLRPAPAGWFAVVAQHHPDAEARARADRLYRAAQPRLVAGRWPWLWLPPSGYDAYRLQPWLRPGWTEAAYYDNDFGTWRVASERWANDQLAAGVSPAEVRQALGRMLMRESAWQQHHGGR